MEVDHLTTIGDCDDCTWPEIVIKASDADSNLHAGMQVLIPCPACGTPPIEQMTWLTHTLDETQQALDLLLADRIKVLFHWAPTNRRKQITRHGLRPSMRPTTNASDYVAPYVCLADTPSWAWALSGAQRGAPAGDWDLWQTSTDRVTDPHVLPSSQANGIHEVRTEHRIYKRHLWLTATRTKP